tara:strand:- start:19171 stop:20157 length:987 start_codon:yes stop_codon:yes gene_type:complete
MKFKKINNFIIFGGGDLLVHFVKKIIENKIPLLVVTSKRQLEEKLIFYKGQKFKTFLKKNKIDFNVIESYKNDVKFFKKNVGKYTAGVSFGASSIFTPRIIKFFDSKLLNFHCMDLPRNRGGGGFSWKIIMNDKKGSSLVHLIDSGIDTGDILERKNFIFKKCFIPIDFIKFNHEKNIKFADKILKKLKNNMKFNIIKQNKKISTYWPRLNSKKDSFINWSFTAEDLVRFIQAFDDPYNGSQTFINNQKVRLKKVKIYKKEKNFHPFQSGIIFRKSNNKIFIASNNYAIIISEVFSKNENIINNLKIGDRFFTPIKYLENSLLNKTRY